jgi:hypothetical protein
MRFRQLISLIALSALSAGVACGSSDDESPNNPKPGAAADPAAAADPNAQATTPEAEVKKILDARQTNYGEALRTASLKLRDRLPDLAEIKQLEAATDDAGKKVAYEKLVDDMLASPEFSQVMIKFWQDTFRTDSGAARFAAEIVVNDRAYTDLFTAGENTCPTYDDKTNAFTDAKCDIPQDGKAGPVAGVLTDPGILGQYFANMAFRRVRFVQETFVCNKFPAEFGANPTPMGNGVYTAAMPFDSIIGKASKADAKVDFQDTKAVVCANCHANLNHLAPLFINYDDKGALKDTAQVKVPIVGEPPAARIDYLPDAEPLKWRVDKEISDIPSLGKALAEDPDVAVCAVNRMWNFAMSRGDIVNDLAAIPAAVTQPYVDQLKGNGMKLKAIIAAVFKSDDFTKF